MKSAKLRKKNSNHSFKTTKPARFTLILPSLLKKSLDDFCEEFGLKRNRVISNGIEMFLINQHWENNQK